jgi:hypothetical protein
MEKETLFCRYCGTKLTPNSIYCSNCGNRNESNPLSTPPAIPISAPSSTPLGHNNPASSQTSTYKVLAIVSVSLLGLIAIVALTLLMVNISRSRAVSSQQDNSGMNGLTQQAKPNLKSGLLGLFSSQTPTITSTTTSTPTSTATLTPTPTITPTVTSTPTVIPTATPDWNELAKSILRIDFDSDSCFYNIVGWYEINGRVTNTSDKYVVKNVALKGEVLTSSGVLLEHLDWFPTDDVFIAPGSSSKFSLWIYFTQVDNVICNASIVNAEIKQ